MAHDERVGSGCGVRRWVIGRLVRVLKDLSELPLAFIEQGPASELKLGSVEHTMDFESSPGICLRCATELGI